MNRKINFYVKIFTKWYHINNDQFWLIINQCNFTKSHIKICVNYYDQTI